jgi:ATP-dependent DNA helicase PIF1
MKLTFITGGAGVGKSYTLKDMVSKEQRKYVVVAPTGIASINCNGVTIHSAFKIDPNNGFVNPNIKYGPLRGLEVIYIDEVSMVSSDLMESIYTAGNMLGVQEVIAFGDLAQLKPVRGGWFFEFKEPDEIQRLTVCYRQGEDLEFAGVLNRIRMKEHRPIDIDCLNFYKGDDGEGITLAFSNATVDRINAQELANLTTPMIENAADMFNMTGRDVTAPELLQVKVGAKVVMLNNDRAKRWQNGSRGEVVNIKDETELAPPVVQVKINDCIHDVEEYTWQKKIPKALTREREEELRVIARDGLLPWQKIEYVGDSSFAMNLLEEAKALAVHSLKNGYELEVVGSFTQFPMKLGYASTVHKSQGLTLDKVIIRPDGFDTTHGLGYVALSRLTTLQGLTTFRKLRRDDFICNPKVLPYL